MGSVLRVALMCSASAALAALAAPVGAQARAAEPARTSAVPRCSAGLVALTFDDGPARGLTRELVRILRDRRAPATFFMVGSRVDHAPRAAKAVARAGFTIGNHTWSHPVLTRLSDAAIRGEIRRTARELRSHGIRPSTLMRPPYGAIDSRVRAVVRGMGLYPVLWTVDSNDWRGGSAGEIASSILGQLRPHGTNIVLQHDGVRNSPASVAAVPTVIRAARHRGYCFARLGRHGQVLPPVPRVSATVSRGNEAGPVAAHVVLTLSTPTSRRVSVRVRARSGTAIAGKDFVAVTRTVWFPVGSTRARIDVPVVNDSAYEPVEDFHVLLDQPYRLRIAKADIRSTIVSDDPL